MNDSIVKAVFKSFFKGVAKILGLAIGLILALALISISLHHLSTNKHILQILPDDQGNTLEIDGNSPIILVIDILGVIGSKGVNQTKIQQMFSQIQKEKNLEKRIKAILLRMRTPGGTTIDSDSIYQTILNYKKTHNVPVFAFVDGFCASGGMYIAACCDKIFASSVSVVGSVGVMMGPSFNVSETLKNLGIKSMTITAGKNKDMLNPFREWQENEEECLREIINDFYLRFVDIVCSGRPLLDKGKLLNEYGTQVFSSQKALQLGFIDENNKSYFDTLKALTETALIKEPYQVVSLKQPEGLFKGFMDQSFDRLNKKINLFLGLSDEELTGQFLYLYHP